jgi:hypothetical protein
MTIASWPTATETSKCALLGWFVLRIPDVDIYDNPGQVLEQIRADTNIAAEWSYKHRICI